MADLKVAVMADSTVVHLVLMAFPMVEMMAAWKAVLLVDLIT
jgi:hypothetical protein